MKYQFNGNTEKRHPPPHLTGQEVYKMVKDVNVVLGKQKRTGKNTEEDDMWRKQLIFWELLYWKDLDICHSIDVMHVEKNVCESLLGTLLNMDGKTRDRGHARTDLKKMGMPTSDHGHAPPPSSSSRHPCSAFGHCHTATTVDLDPTSLGACRCHPLPQALYMTFDEGDTPPLPLYRYYLVRCLLPYVTVCAYVNEI
jgi:hypothetical protein